MPSSPVKGGYDACPVSKPRAVFSFTERKRREGCCVLACCCMGGQKQSVALVWVNRADAGGRAAALSPDVFPFVLPFAGQNHRPQNSCLMVGVERALREESSLD